MVLRGDADIDPAARLRHYTQAVATAPEGSPAAAHAARKRAAAVVDLAADLPMTASLRHELAAAARELEAIGDTGRATLAYARAGDLEGEVRALARAGEVEKVDALLLAQQGRDRDARSRRMASEEVEMLVASGRRREAAALARASPDEGVRARGAAVASRRAAGCIVRAAVRGHEILLVLGHDVVIGRDPPRDDPRQGRIAVASAALSRRHVVVSRSGDEFAVRDLGSRNGTTLRGLTLAGDTRVGDGLELRLGREVPLSLHPATELAGSLAVEVCGTRYVVPLGAAPLGIGRWRLETGDDDWIELITEDAPPAFAGPLQLAPNVTLVVGDTIAAERGGAPVLEVRDLGG